MPKPFVGLVDSPFGRRFPRLAAWVQIYGGLLVIALSAGFFVLAGVMAVVAIATFSTKGEFEDSSALSCERTKRLAPLSTADLIKRGVYRGADAKFALRSIPKDCPDS